MIMIKQYSPELWKKYWLKKLGIEGNLKNLGSERHCALRHQLLNGINNLSKQ